MQECSNCGAKNPDGAQYCNACGVALSIARPEGESRRPVTVVFCDLVGSTALTERLDPESVRAVLARHLEAIRTIVERHGGIIEKFVGDAALAVFGVPQVHEDDALRAVRAANEMRESLAQLNEELARDRGLTVETRTGIASGEVFAGDPSAGHAFVTGSVMNLAARLEQSADPGQILLADETYKLVRDAVEVEEPVSLSLKGIGPVVGRRLLSVSPSASGHARRFDSPLVDRERESLLLHQTFDRVVADRRCQLFTVLGPPGIGKSRLVEEFRRKAEERSLVLQGRCLSYGEGITFWPVAEVVGQAAGLTEADPQEIARGRIAAVLAGVDQAQLVADRVVEAIGLSTGSAAPEETLWAIRLFFEAQAARRPLVLVFDDIHWGESKFLELIEHIADWSRDVPIMLLCLARPELLETRPGWGGGMVNATTILLDTLQPEETDTLVLNLLRATELPPGVSGKIVETAGGYPLFAEEIVSMLIDDNLLVREGDTWVAARDLSEISLPQTIAGLLAARLGRLSSEERTVLERASVIGRDFSAAEVSALTADAERSRVPELLRSLMRKELVRPARSSERSVPDAYRFRHLLIRDAAYHQMAKMTRAGLHERYAGWLVERRSRRIDEGEEIIGYHLEEAHRLLRDVGPIDAHVSELGRRAGEYLATSGRRAFERGDLPAATNLLRRAADLLPESHPAYLETLANLHDCMFMSGSIEEATVLLDDLIERASHTEDEELKSRAELDRLWFEFTTSPLGSTVQQFGEALEAVVTRLEQRDDERNLATALHLLATVQWCSGDSGAMLLQSERSLALARKVGNRMHVAGAASYVATALLEGETSCSLGLARLQALMREIVDDPVAAAAVGLHLGLLLGMVGRFDEARERVAASRDVFTGLGQRRWLVDTASKSGLIARLEGRFDDARRELEQSYLYYREQHDAANAPTSACDLGKVLCDVGKYQEALVLSEYAEIQAVSHDLEPQVGWRCVRARALAAQGSPARSEALAREALGLVRSTDFVNLHADVLVDLAEVLIAVNRKPEAAEPLTEAIGLYRRKGNVVGARHAASIVGIA